MHVNSPHLETKQQRFERLLVHNGNDISHPPNRLHEDSGILNCLVGQVITLGNARTMPSGYSSPRT